MEPLRYLTSHRDSDSVALVYDDGHIPQLLTYKEVFSFSRKISELLAVESYDSENYIVAVSCPVSLHLPCVLLGILGSQAAFWYLAPDDWSKPELYRQLLRQEGVNYLLLDSELLKNEWISQDFTVFNSSQILRQIGLVLLKSKSFNSGPELGTGSLAAYVITTSGTTGQPKVVRVPYQCIWPNISDLGERLKMSAGDSMYMTSPLTFDPSVVDMFLALSNGARLVLTPESVKLDTGRILDVLVRQGVTCMQATPTFLRRFRTDQLRTTILSDVSKLRLLIIGGEQCPTWAETSAWKTEKNRTEFFNIYGITETSCWASIHRITESDVDKVPLGDPLSETSLVVKSENGEILSEGEGLLYLQSDTRRCVIGQSGQVTLSNEICTGDLVRIEKEDGATKNKLYYLGRQDRQVKRQGKRINLDNLEHVFRSLPLVDNVVVHLLANRLSAFVQSAASVSHTNLLTSANSRLPKFSEIDDVMLVEKMPMTSHGKIDHKKLFQMYKNMSEKYELKGIDEIWSRQLSTPCGSFDSKKTFTEFGGDSISAVLLAEKMESAFDLNMPNLVDLILSKSYGELKALIQDHCKVGGRYELGSPAGKRKPTNGIADEATDQPKRSRKGEVSVLIQSISRCSKRSVHGSAHGELENSPLTEPLRPAINPAEREIDAEYKLDLMWQYDTGKCVDASPLVVVDGGKTFVYIGSHSHRFVALSADDGRIVWTRTLGDRVESSACLTSCGRYVVVGCYDHNVYFLSRGSGHVVWTFETRGLVKSSPCVDDVTGDVIVGSHDHHVYSLNVEHRAESWKLNVDNSSVFASPCIVRHPHQVYVATLAGTLAAVKPVDGTVLWSVNVGKPLFSSPCADSGHVVVGSVDRSIHAYNHVGEKIYQFATEGPIFSSPTITDLSTTSCGQNTSKVESRSVSTLVKVETVTSSMNVAMTSRVYVGSHDNHVYCLENGELKWRIKLDGLVYSSPFVCTNQNVILVATNKTLYILDQSGAVLHSLVMPGEIFSSPVVCDNHVLIGCRDNNVYCYKMK